MTLRGVSAIRGRINDATTKPTPVNDGAGMARQLATRVAFSNAGCALQTHGGNGYAVEFPISRVLRDARILSILSTFEEAAEIQAQVIARGLLGRTN